MSRICIIGTGYVGVASAIGFSVLGHDVVGFDVIQERVRGLAAGATPYHEAGLSEHLAAELSAGRLRFVEEVSEAVRGAEFIVVAVGTPSRPDGSADLSYLKHAVSMLRGCEIQGATVVVRSTVPPGTSDDIRDELAGRADVVYAPEFLREGSAVSDFLRPDRIVVGADDEYTGRRYAALLESLEAPVVVTSYRDAEIIKVCSNAFLAMKITFANEVANLCDGVGANALAVLGAIGADRRIGGAFLAPGIGFGGPCFEKDLKSLRYVADSADTPAELASATLRANDRQPRIVVDILESELGSLAGTTIGVWGLAFKAGTDDVRDSLAVRIVDDLISRGAHVRAYDPAISDRTPLIRCDIATDALDAANADALLILTEWPSFAQIDPQEIAVRLRRGIVVDGRNILDMERVRSVGLKYRGVGRGARMSTKSTAAAVAS